MDEPLSNLDAKLRMTMRTEIQQLQAELGTTTVYVTHDQEEAMSMSDRIAVMNNGRIQQLGTPEEVYERPNNRFVAEFIGSPSMNFFNVRHQSGNLSGDGIELVIPEVADHLDTGWYTLGVRPEDIQLDINNEMSNTATVEVVEPIGSQSIVYLNIADSELRVTVSRDEAPAINREIGFIIPPEAIHLFDSDSGEAVGYGKSFTNDTEKNVVSDQSATTESLQGE
jgi:multiple sugar transport system ATP-binding protein